MISSRERWAAAQWRRQWRVIYRRDVRAQPSSDWATHQPTPATCLHPYLAFDWFIRRRPSLRFIQWGSWSNEGGHELLWLDFCYNSTHLFSDWCLFIYVKCLVSYFWRSYRNTVGSNLLFPAYFPFCYSLPQFHTMHMLNEQCVMLMPLFT